MSDERPLERITYTREEAAASLGMSLNSFIRHVAPEVPVVRRGRLRLYPVAGLKKWARDNQEQAGAA